MSVITSTEIKNQFEKELMDLLKKYKTEMEVVGNDGDEKIEVYIPSKYDENNNLISESVTINLGRWVCPD